MDTQCSGAQLDFQPFGRRLVTGRHDGGHMSSDGGGLLLREVDGRIGLTERLAGCFVDHRNAASVEHDLRALVAQRVHALALGYEDLNDCGGTRCCPCWSAGRTRPVRTARGRSTELARAQCGTLRLKLLKVAVRVRITPRRVWLSFPRSHPHADMLAAVLAHLGGTLSMATENCALLAIENCTLLEADPPGLKGRSPGDLRVQELGRRERSDRSPNS